MKVVVVGGTGQVGRLIVPELRRSGHETVVAARSTGVDAVTGEGLSKALEGADAVLDLTNTQERDERKATEYFRTTSANIVAAGAKAGVRHHVPLSIVGVDRVPDLAYYRAKLAQEKAVTDGDVPFTIVRATQFDEFLEWLLGMTVSAGVARLSPVRVQPIALADLVPMLFDIVTGPALNGTVEVAGPEVLPLDEIGRRLLPGVRVASDPAHPAFSGVAPGERALLAGPDARLGTTTLAAWQAARKTT
jgi:uncharacterized protein YbjT (DUF2867 family)